MSLTYDALQKAAGEKQRKLGTPSPTVAEEPPRHPTPPPCVAMATPEKPPRPADGHARGPSFLQAFLAISFFIVVGSIVAIVLLINRPSRPSAAEKPAPPASPASAPPTSTVAAPPALPTVSPSPTHATTDPRFRLTGIMKDPDGKFAAVLNGRVAYEGYSVEGATVKSIERDRVTLDAAGQEIVLRLN